MKGSIKMFDFVWNGSGGMYKLFHTLTPHLIPKRPTTNRSTTMFSTYYKM